jgi:hypothetical protein
MTAHGPAALLLCLATTAGLAQESITPERIKTHLEVLAADSLEGRGAGYPGADRAAAYIAGVFRAAGLRPAAPGTDAEASFLDTFTFHPRHPPEPWLVLRASNVVALLRGSDPRLTDEIVVVGAHYDGQGMEGEANVGRLPAPPGADSTDRIYNAANDNGSGMAALLTLAQALGAPDVTLRRSVIFVAFTGEEHGLVGSIHYVANPPVPLSSHVAMLNLEMVGGDSAGPFSARATVTSADWRELLQAATAATGLGPDRELPPLTDDTDHYPFGAVGIPAVHFGVGGSREHYHRPTDTPDRIAYGKLTTITRYAFTVVTMLANREVRLTPAGTPLPGPGVTGTPATPAELAARGVPDTLGGIKVNAVVPGLPPHRAGLRAGDLIVAVADSALRRDRSAMGRVRQAFAAGPSDLRVTVLRAGERAPLILTVPAGR